MIGCLSVGRLFVAHYYFNWQLAPQLFNEPSRSRYLVITRLCIAGEATFERYANAVIVMVAGMIRNRFVMIDALYFTSAVNQVVISDAGPSTPVNMEVCDCLCAAESIASRVVNYQHFNCVQLSRVINFIRMRW